MSFAGRIDAAIDAVHAHLAAWPRDALVVATAANPNGLIGGSGRIGQKRQIAELMDSLAPHYGDDYWFLSYHAMALSEDGRLAAARPKIERSVALNPNNAHGAHGFAHVCYESGEAETARAYLSSWLATYPRDGFFYGHLSWHLSLCEIQLGNWAAGAAAISGRHRARPPQRRTATENVGWGGVFMALGTRRSSARCRRLARDVRVCEKRAAAAGQRARRSARHPGAGGDAAMTPRSTPAPARWRSWRAKGVTRPAPTCRNWRAALRRSNAGILPRAIEALAPLAGENERIGGSRAQHDLIEFTLLKAYLNADRLEEARRLLGARRPGASGVPVSGVAAVR